MDLGLGGFIEKFEAYFGKKITFVLLLLVGLALASTCANLIITYTIKPVFEAIRQAIDAQTFDIFIFANIAQSISLLSIVILVAGFIVTAWQTKRIGRSVGRIGDVASTAIECLNIARDNLKLAVKATRNEKLKGEINRALDEIQNKLDALHKPEI